MIAKMQNPLVTIIIPSYNHKRWIAQAIESVTSQTYKNIELIIVDDGSTDGSREVIEKFHSDPRIKAIFKDQNKGQGHSFNLGISLAKGKYISILPSDDWYLPQKTWLQVEKFEKSSKKVGVIYGKGRRFYEDTKTTKEVNMPLRRGNVFLNFVNDGNFVFPASPMFRKEVFDKYKFDEDFCAEGEAIFTKIAASYEFDYVDEVVAVMRAHQYNVGNSLVEAHCEEHIKWWEKYLSDPFTRSDARKQKGKIIGKIRRMHGLSLITELFEYKRARKYLLLSIKNYPGFIFDHKILAGLILTVLPRSISDKIAIRKKKTEHSFNSIVAHDKFE